MSALSPSVIGDELLAKAERYLCAGRLTVTHRANNVTLATCDGDTGSYELQVTSAGAKCSCPARALCSHLIALAIVTGGSPKETT